MSILFFQGAATGIYIVFFFKHRHPINSIRIQYESGFLCGQKLFPQRNPDQKIIYIKSLLYKKGLLAELLLDPDQNLVKNSQQKEACRIHTYGDHYLGNGRHVFMNLMKRVGNKSA